MSYLGRLNPALSAWTPLPDVRAISNPCGFNLLAPMTGACIASLGWPLCGGFSDAAHIQPHPTLDAWWLRQVQRTEGQTLRHPDVGWARPRRHCNFPSHFSNCIDKHERAD